VTVTEIITTVITPSPRQPSGGLAVTARGQHSASYQNAVDLIQAAHRITKINRDALGDAHYHPKNLTFTAGARQMPILQRRPCRPPVNRGHQLTMKATAELNMDQKIITDQPPPVTDQQLNSSLADQQTLRPRPKRGYQLIEARSVSGTLSTKFRIRP
jgi:hypothetical protein